MKVGVRSYFSVGRPPVKFHRVWSLFDAPTDNYSGIIACQTSDVFGLRKQSPGLSLLFSQLETVYTVHSPLAPNLSSLVSPRPSSRARPKIVPDPTRALVTVVSGSSPNIYKMSPFLYLDSPTFLSQPSDLNRRVQIALYLIAIYI